jgi:hypothetical protein
MLEKFQELRFNYESEARIQQANAIINEYMGQGFSLTVRQLYYQFVARGLMANKQSNYKKLVKLLSRARLAGLVDWRALEDRTRSLEGGDYGFDGVEEYVRSIADGYAIKWWDGQDNYVEVWVEKEALSGVVSKPADRWRVPYFCCRGYTSQSEQYKAGKRFRRHQIQGRTCHILHLGDHDPSGIDMTRDNRDRLDMFARMGIRVKRLALNMDQVEELNPPPNPVKTTDSRHKKYLDEYGAQSWELDALDPTYIANLITGS